MSPWFSDLVLSSQSDERLVSLARAGYDRAFVAIFERYKRRLLSFALGLGLGSRAEDVVQQAFLSAFAALRDQREVGHLSGWLHQIVRHGAIRTAGRNACESPLDTEALSSVNVEEQVESRLEAQAVLLNLGRLPERQRDALIQTSLEGQSRSEVAVSMGLSEGAVRQLVHRARITLRSAAAALVPFPVVAWAARSGGRVVRAGPAAEIASRSLGNAANQASGPLAPIAAGVASAGGGVVVKAGAIIAATGLVAGGLAISHGGHHPGDTHRGAATRLIAEHGANPRRPLSPVSSRGSATSVPRGPTSRHVTIGRSGHVRPESGLAHRKSSTPFTTGFRVSSSGSAGSRAPGVSGSGHDGGGSSSGNGSSDGGSGSPSQHSGSGSGSGQDGGGVSGGSTQGGSDGQSTSTGQGGSGTSGSGLASGSGDGSGDTSTTGSGSSGSDSGSSSTNDGGSSPSWLGGSGGSGGGSGD